MALSDTADNPRLPHSYELPGLQPGIRLYHLRHSRRRARVEGQIVREPRHFIAYRTESGDIVIVRLLHDRMEISRHLEKSDES